MSVLVRDTGCWNPLICPASAAGCEIAQSPRGPRSSILCGESLRWTPARGTEINRNRLSCDLLRVQFVGHRGVPLAKKILLFYIRQHENGPCQPVLIRVGIVVRYTTRRQPSAYVVKVVRG